MNVVYFVTGIFALGIVAILIDFLQDHFSQVVGIFVFFIGIVAATEIGKFIFNRWIVGYLP